MLRNLPFRKKLLLVYFTCVILPLLVVSIFFFSITVMKWENKGRADLEQNISAAKYDIQQLFDKALLNVEYIYYDETLYDWLSLREGSTQQFLNIAMDMDAMFQPFLLNETSQNIQIFSSNKQLYRCSTLKRIEDLEKEVWYPEFSQSDLPVAFIQYYEEHDREQVFSVIKKLDYRTQDKDMHLLKLDLPWDKISASLKQNSNVDNVYLLDQNNSVIAVRGYRKECPELEYAIGDFIDITQKDIIYQKLDLLGEYKLVAQYSGRSIGTFDLEMGIFIFLVLLSLIISTWMIKLVDKSVTQKLSELTYCLRKLENEEFVLVDESNLGLDEIGILSSGMNGAVKKMEFLINEVYASQMRKLEIDKAKEKAELKALQGQVNPHFMFNIFEVVRMKSLKNGDTETSNIMKSISTMFRSLINSKDDLITLKDEMVFVSAYLQVSNYNMDDEVTICLDIDENALDCRIPKMAIQVFVENAFYHGLENIDENRCFALSVKVKDSKLMICVVDNGIGMNETTVNAINEGKLEQREDGSGVGIMNVYKRLKLYFGDEFQLTVVSKPHKETKITMVIPVTKE